MRLLVFGKTGQVARELARQCPEGWRMACLGREDADLGDPDACAAALRGHDVDAVINAAAYTAVDNAEDEEPLATVINGAAPTLMAQTAADKGVPFLHVSTDYVFDGSGRDPWKPDDAVAPLGAYGRGKLTGETGVRGAGGTYAILRTSWVFSAHGGNFVKTMLRLAETRDRLTIVADQVGGPTAASDIARALLRMAETFHKGQGKPGTYHFAGTPDVSWADFAREIFDQTGQAVEVVDIPASDYPAAAARPQNSRLDCSMLETVFGIKRPDWRVSLRDVLDEVSGRTE